jgi:hypothetical protein
MQKDSVKILISKPLKRLFKATCAHQDTDMSAVLSQLLEQWCLRNNKTVTVAQLIAENRVAAQSANLSNIDAIASGAKPTESDLVKLAAVLGLSVRFLRTICDRTFSKV